MLVKSRKLGKISKMGESSIILKEISKPKNPYIWVKPFFLYHVPSVTLMAHSVHGIDVTGLFYGWEDWIWSCTNELIHKMGFRTIFKIL